MKIRSTYFWLSTLALFLALAGIAYRVTFTRYYADDFCMAGDALHLGLIEMLGKWYYTWTGRFMFILGTGLFGLGGPRFSGWLPVLIGGIWLLGLWWAFLPLIQRSSWPRPRLVALLAATLSILVLLSSTPNLFQSFFWQNGMVNYSLPLVGLTYSVGIILRVWLQRIKSLPAGAALFLLAFISGGFTESFSAMQVTFFILLFLIVLVLGNREMRERLLPVLCLALLGGLAAMLVVIIAPGNAIRLQGVEAQTSRPGIVRIVIFSMRNMTHIFGKYFLQTPFWALTSILPPFLAGWLLAASNERPATPWTIRILWQQNWVKGLVLVLGSALVLVTAACAPVVFAMNAYPDDRTILVPQFMIVLATVGVSATLGTGLCKIGWLPKTDKKQSVSVLLQVGILAALLLAAGTSIWQSAHLLPEMRANTANWDARADIIQQAVLSGEDEVTVAAVDSPFGLANLSADPNNWVNQCMADYYGIQQIISK